MPRDADIRPALAAVAGTVPTIGRVLYQGARGPLPEDSHRYMKGAGGIVRGLLISLQSSKPIKDTQLKKVDSLLYELDFLSSVRSEPNSYDAACATLAELQDAIERESTKPGFTAFDLEGVSCSLLQIETLTGYVQTDAGAMHLIQSTLAVTARSGLLRAS